MNFLARSLNGFRMLFSILFVFFLASCEVRVVSSPLPKGQVEINVKFKNLSTDNYNKLNGFVKKLPKDYMEGFENEFTSSHSLGNDGEANQRYKPNHKIPSPEVEKAMQDRLQAFLKENGINEESVELKLRYGNGEPTGDSK